MFSLKPLRHRARKRRLGKPRFIKHHTERLRTLLAQTTHQCNQRTGIHPTGQKHAERHITHEMQSHRLFQLSANPRNRFHTTIRNLFTPCKRNLNFLQLKSLIDFEIMPRHQLPHTLNNRERRRNRPALKIRLNTRAAQPSSHQSTREQRPQLRRKHELVFRNVVVKRLDTKPIARQQQSLLRVIPKRERKHPTQPAKRVPPPPTISPQHHLRIRIRRPLTSELAPQVFEVVRLAVIRDPIPTHRIMHRLMTRSTRINNREPRVAQHDLAALRHTTVIRPAMPLRLIHPLDRLARAVSKNPRDATHARKMFHTKAQRQTRRALRRLLFFVPSCLPLCLCVKPTCNYFLRVTTKSLRPMLQRMLTHTVARTARQLPNTRLAQRTQQRLLITRRNQPTILPLAHKLQRRPHAIRRNHRQPRRESLRHHEPPSVITRRHTQHIRSRILARQLLPISKPEKLNPLLHTRQLLHQRLLQWTIINNPEPHIRNLKPRKRRRQQIDALPRDQRTTKQKHTLTLLFTVTRLEALQVRKVRQG